MMATIGESHDPARTSWVNGADRRPDFSIRNLPYGISKALGGHPRAGVAIGDRIVDLAAATPLLPATVAGHRADRTLNRLPGLPTTERLALRRRSSEMLWDPAHRKTVMPSIGFGPRIATILPVRA